MVDESANNWVHWYAEVSEPGSDHGSNIGKYIGPYPPEGSGDHTYAVYVYALEDGALFFLFHNSVLRDDHYEIRRAEILPVGGLELVHDLVDALF